MSNFTLKVDKSALEISPSYDVASQSGTGLMAYNATMSGSPWEGYTHAAGDTITVTKSGSGEVFTATLASYEFEAFKLSNHSGTGFELSTDGSDSVVIADANGATKVSGTWQQLHGYVPQGTPESRLSLGENYVPAAGDTFSLSRTSTGEQFDAVVVSWTPNAAQYEASDLVVSGSGSIDLSSTYYDLDSPLTFYRGGVAEWELSYTSALWHFDQPNVVLGGSSSQSNNQGGDAMSSKNFTHLIGKPPASATSGQRMPELIDIAGGDELHLGPVTIDSLAITAALFTGQISDIANHDTSALAEDPNGQVDPAAGSESLYFSVARARNALASPSISKITDSATSQAPSFTYDPSSGVYSLELRSDQSIRELLSGDADSGLTFDNESGAFSLAQSIKVDATPTFAGLTINGNLQVTGTQLIANVETVEVKDNIIHLNKTDDGSPAVTPAKSGLRIETADEQNDRAFLWVQDAVGGARFQAVDMPEADNADAPLGALLPIEASMFHGPLTGDVTGQVSDISNHDTDALTEGSANLYFTDDRVHAALSASQGVVYDDAGGFQADIDANSQLAITKQSGLNIAFSVDDSMDDTASPHHGSLSYSSNQLTFIPVTVADVRGDISASQPIDITPNNDVYHGSVSYDQSTGVIAVVPAKRSQVRQSLSVNTNELVRYNSTTGVISTVLDGASDIPLSQGEDGLHAEFAASKTNASGTAFGSVSYSAGQLDIEMPTKDEIKSLFSADGDSALSYNDGVFSLEVTALDKSTARAFTPSSNNTQSELDAENLQKVASISESNGAIELDVMTVAQIRAMFDATGSESDNGISYDAEKGLFTVDPISSAEIRGKLSVAAPAGLDDDPSDNTDLLASVHYDSTSGQISSKAVSAGQIRGLMDVFMESPAQDEVVFGGLTYAPLTGTYSLTRVTRSEVKDSFQGSNAIQLAKGEIGEVAELSLILPSGQDADGILSITANGLRADLSAGVDTAVQGDEQFGGLTEDKGVFTLQRVKRSEIRGTLSAVSDKAVLYDSSTGEIDLALEAAESGKVSILSQGPGGLKASLEKVADDDSVGLSATATERAAQRLAELTIDEAQIKLAAMDIADIRNAFGVGANSNASLTYDNVAGEFSLADAQVFSVVEAEAFVDSGSAFNAAADIPAGALVDHEGKLAQALRDEWEVMGSNRDSDQIASGSDMKGKIEIPATGSIHGLCSYGDAPAAGDWLYLSAKQPGKVVKAIDADADSECVVLVGRAMGGPDANGIVEVCMHIQFMYNM